MVLWPLTRSGFETLCKGLAVLCTQSMYCSFSLVAEELAPMHESLVVDRWEDLFAVSLV